MARGVASASGMTFKPGTLSLRADQWILRQKVTGGRLRSWRTHGSPSRTGPRFGGIPATTYCSWGASQTVSCPGCVLEETSSLETERSHVRPRPRPLAPPLAPPPPQLFTTAHAPATLCAAAGRTYSKTELRHPGHPGTDSRALHRTA